MPQTRVLIVDNSALIRQMLTQILASDPSITVVGAAPDPIVAREMIKSLNPDVVTLDIEMPRMDGLVFLQKIMTLRPMPVVMISSLTQKGADTALRALEIGAVDYVAKPTIGLSDGLLTIRDEIVSKVKAAGRAHVKPLAPDMLDGPVATPRLANTGYSSSEKLIAVGASTGGVEALHAMLSAFPPDAPAILVTQHMPPMFTGQFRPTARPALRRDRHPGQGWRARAARTCLHRARFAAPRTGAVGGELYLPAARTGAGVGTSPLGGRAVPVGRARGRRRRCRHHPDRHGQGRRVGTAGDAPCRCLHDRAG